MQLPLPSALLGTNLHHVVEHLQHMFCPWRDRPRTIWQSSHEIERKFMDTGVHC